MVDKTRGEAVVTLDGKKITLVPTYAALADMEDRLDKGSIEMLILMAEKRAKTRQLAIIVSALSDLEEEAAGQLVASAGIANVTATLSTFLIGVVGGGSSGGSKNAPADRK